MNNLTSQVRRASSSVPLNIAEGCSRHSKKAFLQFLMYAYGSSRELQVLLMLSRDLKYISLEDFNNLDKKLDRLSGKLFLFLKNVEGSNFYDWFKK
jgi:four helix bundle protein